MTYSPSRTASSNFSPEGPVARSRISQRFTGSGGAAWDGDFLQQRLNHLVGGDAFELRVWMEAEAMSKRRGGVVLHVIRHHEVAAFHSRSNARGGHQRDGGP